MPFHSNIGRIPNVLKMATMAIFGLVGVMTSYVYAEAECLLPAPR